MKNTLLLFLALNSLLNVFSQQWKIGTDHKISFSSSEVSGIFKELTGTINFDGSALSTSKFELKIKVETISTGNGMMNSHAKGEEWFNSEKYPYITFVSNKIEKTGTGYNAIGKIEIKGVKKDITIPFTCAQKGSKATFIAKFNVDRTDFGVGKKGNDVSETLKITATIPVSKK
jgi:polyisoprenoid-binding protein YceI